MMAEKRVELMAPLKNYQSLNAVITRADAVYFGVESLNMRMYSDNFKLDELNSIVKLCHDNGIKSYLTTNVVIYENEISLLEKLLTRAYEAEVDAVIVHDVGAIELAKEKGLKFHISTQANISNSNAAKFYESLGAERLILARELSLEQIKEIKTKVKTSEIEVFVHGAQCTSISGRCYFSAELCGSQDYSANRGKCIQPCRKRWRVLDDQNNELLYDGVFFINSKDLCMIEHIPKLIEANIDAFKIEGRMRHPHYVEIVTKIYREAIEAYYDGTFTKKKVGRWVTELKQVYNRGFTPGFYFKRVTEEDHQHKSPANLSHFRYIEVGQIEDYNQNTGYAIVTLYNGYLSNSHDLIIMGKNTDTYIHQYANEMKYQGKMVKKSPRGTKIKNVTIELKIKDTPTGGGQDKIFVFTDETYKKKKYSL